MKATEFRTLIKESIQEYIKEIDAAGNRAALEAKIKATTDAIDKRKKLTSKDGLDEVYHEFLDERKMKEMTSEIKLLEKSLTKYGNMLEKMDAKNAPKMEEIKDEDVGEEIIDEVSIDENDPEEESLEEAKKKMTTTQKEKKEDIVKGMKKSKSFGKSKEEKGKMYATATKLAMKESEVLNESFLHMQKLAGLITEAEYKAKLDNNSEDK